MKKKNALLSLVLVLAVSAGALVPAYSAEYKPKNFVINPTSLLNRLVRSNFPVLSQLNKVHQAKSNVMIARGKLLPSLNLGAAAATSGPTFLLSAVSFLFPFLLPSNWANLYQNQHLLEAEKVGYRLVQLNQYASAYTLYATILADLKLREVLVTQHNDLVTIRDWLINQRQFVGSVPQEEIDSADAQALVAYASIANMDKLLVTEKSSLSEMLSIDVRDNMTLETAEIAPSPVETLELSAAVAKAQAASVEMAQVNYLDKAAQETKFSKTFGFMGGGSMNVYQDGAGTAFNDLKVNQSFSIGFDYVPTIQLANENLQAIRLRRDELKNHIAHVLQASQGSIVESKKALGALTDAEEKLRRVYQAEFLKYTLGMTDLLHVIDAERTVAQATASKVKAQLDLDLLRIGLHRQMLSDQFASIPGCKRRPEAEEVERNWFKRLFKKKAPSLTIDQACKPAS